MSEPIYETNFDGLGTPRRGKVRDVYDLGCNLLIVSTDRISAFDVVMPDPIPGKGEILNQMSWFFLRMCSRIIGTHFITMDVTKYPDVCRPYSDILRGRSMLVQKCKPLPVEVIVRGYMFGSAWKDYQQGKPTCGISFPPGLLLGSKLDEPIVTPTTKAPDGEHDLPITYEVMDQMVGGHAQGELIRKKTIECFDLVHGYALPRRAIVADTKLEFGIFNGGILVLIDEVFTPDSSRFWPVAGHVPGQNPKSFDKQFLRDYLDGIRWNKKPPAPHLPQFVINETAKKYQEALQLLVSR